MSATLLGQPAGVSLYLKCESLQKTGSFKVRGALNKLSQLDANERARGVVAVSAGNHAQALAWGAAAAGVTCTVVMPETASRTKVEASKGYGAHVVLAGDTGKAFDKAHALAEEHGYVFVHPFEDEQVVAGAGTVGLEILEDLADVDAVVVPIGGGGLIAGVATAIKARASKARVFGVEPTGAASMRRNGLQSRSWASVDGTVARPSRRWRLASTARRCRDSFDGSTASANAALATVYSWPQHTRASPGNALRRSSESSIWVGVPSNKRPQPRLKRVSPQNKT